MTSITYGGGPTTEARSTFSGLREGSHVPGYQGYCPTIKYRIGKRYGQDTYEIAQDLGMKKNSGTPTYYYNKPDYNKVLPEATGDNKYTKTMVPGYTGYIPRATFKFGGTYKDECDVSISEHLNNYDKHSQKLLDLKQSSQGFPSLKALKQDPEVRDRLNTYRDGYIGRPMMIDDRRALTEPPIPGYKGFVPRIHTTELGLGCRYHEMSKNGFEKFKEETDLHAALKREPNSSDVTPQNQVLANRRLYPNDGMIPKYTGYIPQKRYIFGHTYGDTTRSLDVCAHDKSSYGEYMRQNIGQSMA